MVALYRNVHLDHQQMIECSVVSLLRSDLVELRAKGRAQLAVYLSRVVREVTGAEGQSHHPYRMMSLRIRVNCFIRIGRCRSGTRKAAQQGGVHERGVVRTESPSLPKGRGKLSSTGA